MNQLISSCLLDPAVLGTPAAPPGRRGARTPSIDLGDPGRCSDTPALVLANFDNSGSVACAGGSDPIGNRFAEARLAFDAVAKRCRCGNDLAALTTFDTPTSADVAPTTLRSGLAVLEQGLRIPADGAGSSCLGPSLQAARRLIEDHPDHTGVLVVLSDFELFDGNVSAVLNDLCVFPGLVHAVVLRSVPPQQLVDDPNVIVTHISHGGAPGSVAKAVFAALTATRRHKKQRR